MVIGLYINNGLLIPEEIRRADITVIWSMVHHTYSMDVIPGILALTDIFYYFGHNHDIILKCVDNNRWVVAINTSGVALNTANHDS